MLSKDFDVVICGSGSAGFCAAVSAARNGAKTALIEKYQTPGGILTVTGNNSIDQFNNPFRDKDKMVIAGVGWEFVRRLAAYGFADIPDMDAVYRVHNQYGIKINPAAASALMDQMLLEAGVTLLYGQPVVDVRAENGHINALLISTKAGLAEVHAKIYVDCSGDGDISAWAGAAFEAGDGHGGYQPGTLRYYPVGNAVSPDDFILNFGDNCNHVAGMDATDSDRLTAAQIAAREAMFEKMLQSKNGGERVMALAPEAAPREGRRILGKSYMLAKDYINGTVFDDSVCYSFWFVDIHREDAPSYIRYITDGSTPTIRYSAMLPTGFTNLITAGRCISSDRETNSALRVKASCMAMGDAAGTAAAMAATEGITPEQVDISKLKATLAANGCIVPGVTGFRDFRDMMRK